MGTAARGFARTGRLFREALLTLAALGGAACILLTILAFTGGYSLIMFKTGSMSPTIPAGSVALVQRIPASELAVGDVATVDRSDALPITHRITGISPGTSNSERVITMRGDANDSDDPLPYTISDARIVRGSVPQLASVIVWFGSPWVLGTITVAAAALVTWAFWPRRTRQEVPDEIDDGVAPTPEPATRRERRAAGLLAAIAILSAGTATLLPVSPASAAGLLSIRSNLNAGGMYLLDADEPFFWDLDVDARSAPRDGTLTVDLAGSGDPGMRITAEVRECDVPWSAAGCAGAERVLRGSGPLPLDGARNGLVRTTTPKSVHLRIAVTATVEDEPSATATLTVRATAAQQTSAQHFGGTTVLPPTGGPSLAVLAAPAAVLIGLGAALAARARRRDAS